MSGFVRITSGEFRGRKIATPDSPAVHPMGDREKLALFNTLGPLSGSEHVLDCYCGSGALGLEAISRGAKSVVFVDRDVRTASENIRTFGVEAQCEVIKSSVNIFTSGSLRRTASKDWTVARNDGPTVHCPNKDVNAAFDIILLDPPYTDFHSEDFEGIEDLLAPGGRLVLSHPAEIAPESLFESLEFQKTKKFARCHLSFYTK